MGDHYIGKLRYDPKILVFLFSKHDGTWTTIGTSKVFIPNLKGVKNNNRVSLKYRGAVRLGKLSYLHRKLAIQAPGKLDIHAPEIRQRVSDSNLLLSPTCLLLSGECIGKMLH
jgi:hypothetical protein